jgi:small subunit ribosomal protein S20
MANHVSAEKRARRATRRTAINRTRTTRVRSLLKKVETAIEAGDQAAAKAALQTAEPEIMRGAQKGVLKKNTASRQVSRLSKRVKSMG